MTITIYILSCMITTFLLFLHKEFFLNKEDKEKRELLFKKAGEDFNLSKYSIFILAIIFSPILLPYKIFISIFDKKGEQ